MKKMKVLHAGPASVHVTRFVEAFHKEDVEHLLLTDAPIDVSNVLEVRCMQFQTLNPLKLWKALKQLRRFLQEVQPDIIHVHQINRMAFWVTIIARKHAIPVVETAWGSDVLLMPHKNSVFRFMVTSTLKRGDIITGDSQEMIDGMRSLQPNKAYHWVQYGVEPVESGEKAQVIYSNRLLKPLYNIDRIIALFSDFHARHPEWKLLIGGSGEEESQLREKVREYQLESAVQFCGWLDQDANRNNYAAASIYVSLPSSDGTSVSLLEAMSAGCIPVVSDLPANRAWIVDNVNGVIDTPGNENPFDRALKLPRELVAAQNRSTIAEKATRDRSVQAFYQFYTQLTNGNN